MINQRKGITPVIAIVLLLLITVGAVGVVYTQFQGLVEGNDAEEQLNQQQRIQQSSYSITAVTQTTGSSSGNDIYRVRIRNTGDETLDLSSLGTVLVGEDGNSPQSIQAVAQNSGDIDCDLGSLSPGNGVNCDTGVQWGNANDGQPTSVEFQVGETVKDTATCFENGNDACGN